MSVLPVSNQFFFNDLLLQIPSLVEDVLILDGNDLADDNIRQERWIVVA